MLNIKIPPQLNLPKTRFEKIRNGSVGIVYRISREYAAKILFIGDIYTNLNKYELRQDSNTYFELEHEADVGQRLFEANEFYKADIFVPEIIGVESLKIFRSVYP